MLRCQVKQDVKCFSVAFVSPEREPHALRNSFHVSHIGGVLDFGGLTFGSPVVPLVKMTMRSASWVRSEAQTGAAGREPRSAAINVHEQRSGLVVLSRNKNKITDDTRYKLLSPHDPRVG